MENGILVDRVKTHTGALLRVKGLIVNGYIRTIAVNPGCSIETETYGYSRGRV